ncbi:MAG: hypothetical protein HOQ20_14820 [Bradyrhizobium sp.]|nr:hypothetical protein [Bradyrhizobium sp.]
MAESATIILFMFIPPSEGSTVINGLETAPFHERLFINLLSQVRQMPDVCVAPIRRSSAGDPTIDAEREVWLRAPRDCVALPFLLASSGSAASVRCAT